MVQLIIRDDDLNYFNRPEDIERAYSRMPDLPVSFACVPYVMDLSTRGACPETNGNKVPRPFGDNAALVDYIKKGIKEGRFDVLLHGYSHEYRFDSLGNRYSEMVWRESNDSSMKIPDGKMYLEKLFDTSISWFVAPSNTISKENLKVVYENNLNYSGIIRLRFDREFSFRAVKNYFKRIYYRYVSKVNYPGVLDYGTHLELNAEPLHSINPEVQYNHFIRLFVFCKKKNCPMVINVHCWDMRDHPEKYDALFSFLQYAISKGAKPSIFGDLKI